MVNYGLWLTITIVNYVNQSIKHNIVNNKNTETVLTAIYVLYNGNNIKISYSK